MPEESKEIKVNVKVEHEPGCVTCVAVAVLTIALFSIGSCNINIGSSIPVKTQHVEVQK